MKSTTMSILKKIYSAVTLVGSVALIPIFFCFKRGRSRIWERFGVWGELPRDILWFHGASVGEVSGLLPLIELIKSRFPEKPILVTATSVTGLDRAMSLGVETRLLPFDSNIWLSKAFKSKSFQGLVISEREVWPNLLEQLKIIKIPVMMVNARLSRNSFRFYHALPGLFVDALKSFRKILSSDGRVVEAFVSLGVARERILVTGNSKYERKPSVSSEAAAEALRREFFRTSDPIIVLGSLRVGEEKLWFPAIKEALDGGHSFNVVIAPRHSERFEYFRSKLQENGLTYTDRSASSPSGTETSPGIILLDTIGELESVYSFASLAFIGGTLVPVGGHNPLEPAPYSVPICMGPSQDSISDITEQLRGEGGLIELKDFSDIMNVIQRVSERDANLKVIGEQAKKVWRANQGACDSIVRAVEEEMGSL